MIKIELTDESASSIDFILKNVVERLIAIFWSIEAKNLRITFAIVQFFNEKWLKKSD